MAYLIFLIPAVSLLVSCVLASDYIKLEKSSIKIEFAPATFGKITLGRTYNGELYYDEGLNSNVCSYSNLNNATMPEVLPEKPFILMIDRGNCTFVKKALYAQKLGAFMLVIANSIENQKNEDVYMMDDGQGKDVNIETVMITYKDGLQIKKELKKVKKNKISVEVNFDSNKKDEVFFETVFSSINAEYYDLLNILRNYLITLEEAEKFTFYPVYYLETHPSYNADSNQSYKDCFTSGKYCSFMSNEHFKYKVPNGRVVLIENLRQICIFKDRESEKNITLFLDYMQEFRKSCLNANSPSFNEECSKQVMKSIGLKDGDITKVESCIIESFDSIKIDSESSNNILIQEKAFQDKVGVKFNPSIIVNRKLIMVRLKLIIKIGSKNFK